MAGLSSQVVSLHAATWTLKSRLLCSYPSVLQAEAVEHSTCAAALRKHVPCADGSTVHQLDPEATSTGQLMLRSQHHVGMAQHAVMGAHVPGSHSPRLPMFCPSLTQMVS